MGLRTLLPSVDLQKRPRAGGTAGGMAQEVLAPMQDKPIGAANEGATTAAQDVKDRARVLREVLDLYPETLTLDELVRELTIDSVEFEERDRVQRAVRDLIAAGLLHRVGDLVLPTMAAVNFHELTND